MAAPVILSVLIPTTGRRPELLAQVETALREQIPGVEILTVSGYTWGEGLNQLAAVAKGDYLSCCCDDTLPQPGWFEAARAIVDEGLTPASRYVHRDGTPLRPGTDDAPHRSLIAWCRSFLLTPAIYQEVGPFIDATWYTDIDYSERLRQSGREIVACDGYTFTHLEGERDWRTPDVDAYEREQYQESHRRQGIA